MSDHRAMHTVMAFSVVAIIIFLLMSVFYAFTEDGPFFNSWTFIALLIALFYMLCASLLLALLYQQWRHKPYCLIKMSVACVLVSVIHVLLTEFDLHDPAQILDGLLYFAPISAAALWVIVLGGHGLLGLMVRRQQH